MQTANHTLVPAATRESASSSVCLHCRSPLTADGSEFCCRGCAYVHTLLTHSGLDRYYTLRGARTLSPVATRTLHEEPWLELLEAQLGAQAGVRRVTLDIQGLQCGACIWLIEALFKREPGALRIDVNPALGRLSCLVEPSFPVRAFVLTVEEFGYRLGPANKTDEPLRDSLLLRTGVCGALAVNAMLLGAATYLGLEHGPLYALIQNASFALATLSALIGGSYFVERAFRSLKRGVLHLDLPIALGMGLAYAGSVWSLYFGDGGSSYLDTVSVFIALMLVGRLLEERLVEQNRQKLLKSDGASGLLTRRLSASRTELVSCPMLASGDTLLICTGEIVPVRARLEANEADCALDWINGESEPRKFVRNDELPAGAINVGSSAIRVLALTGFDRSDLDLLLRDEGRSELRARGDFWDRVARYYVLLVLLAAAVGAAAWALAGGSLGQVLDVTTAVLVVTCPCAFGIATPLAYELAVAHLRGAGLFVRDGSFFDRAARVRRIVFDKTGTLTTGVLALRDPSVLNGLAPELRAVLFDMCAHSGHPKSVAIAQALHDLDPGLVMHECLVRELPGAGIEAVIDGVLYRLGAPRWAAPESDQSLEAPVFSVAGRVACVLPTGEVLRPDAPHEAHALESAGYELWIASGDAQERVDELARSLEVAREHALGNLTPSDKLALIERLDHDDTLMIGDGINDGPALSRALCAGTPAIDRPFVPARTDFYFLTAGLSPVRFALHMSRRVRGVIRHALVFAAAYNVLAVSLSYAGLMRPWLAALLMPASSLCVLTYTALALSTRRVSWKS
jgi:Cu2+-exporting ATPase